MMKGVNKLKEESMPIQNEKVILFVKRIMEACEELLLEVDLNEIELLTSHHYNLFTPDARPSRNHPGFFTSKAWDLGNGKKAPALVYVCYEENYVEGLNPWKDCNGDDIIKTIEDWSSGWFKLSYKDFKKDELGRKRLFAAVFERRV
jgi:hypothetical protein